MAAMDQPAEGNPLRIERRIDHLNWRQNQMAEQIQELRKDVDTQGVGSTEVSKAVAVLTTTAAATAKEVHDLKATMNKLVWAIVGLALTIAAGAIALALQLATSGVTPPS